MKDENLTQDVMKILEEAPVARKALRENYDNLVNVADYCHNNYIQAGDSSTKALEETKNFATQSLASVAYQISTLASSVLSLLDAQTNQLLRMESSINLIGQTVEMHKEKVSRRQIGIFTAAKRVPRCHKILPPSGTQPRPPYSRRPINYQQLDGMGHGMKVSGKQAEKTGTIRKPSVRSNKPLEPIQCPVAPPTGSSSFGKPVAPPSIPPTSDIITTLLDEAPPPPPPTANEMSAQCDMVDSLAPPPPPPPPLPDAPVENSVVPPPPPPPPTPSEALTNYSTPPLAPPIAPPLTLETVVEENSLPSPSPPPPPPPPTEDDDAFPPLPSDTSGLLAPPPPPPLSQEEDESLLSRRSRRRRSPPASRSLSLRVRSGPASRCRYTRSLFLPAVQSLMIPPPPPYPPPHAPAPPSSTFSLLPLSSCSSSPRLCLPARLEHLDLEIPAPPPPLLLDERIEFDDIIPPLPPPVDYDANAPQQYLEKVVALYSYEASKPEELSLAEGDVVYLTRRLDDGWYEGVVNGKQGLFPENYVQSSG